MGKGEIVKFVDPVKPLSRVEINLNFDGFQIFQGEESLPDKELVIFKFLKQQYMKCFKIAPDEQFVQYLQYLQQGRDTSNVYDFVNMLLYIVSMPQFINTYKFLVNVDGHALQDVFQEKDRLVMLEKTNAIFTDFVNKVDIWSKLEQQYDFNKD